MFWILGKITLLYTRDLNDVRMINDNVLMILLAKEEQVDINGLYFMTIIFFQVCVNTGAIKVLINSKGSIMGERRISRNGGYSGNGGIL